MRVFTIDIETQMANRHFRFPLRASKLLCLSYKELGVDGVHTLTTNKDIVEFLDMVMLDDDNVLAAHNGAGFDVPALNHLLDYAITCRVYCTQAMSRILWPFDDLGARDMDNNKVPDELVGKLSLEAFGHRLDMHKGTPGIPEGMTTDEYWKTAEFTPEMQKYCEQDVLICERLYEITYAQAMKQKTNTDVYGRVHPIGETLAWWINKDRDVYRYNLTKEQKEINDAI